ncbi:Aly1p KNAG_0C01550 [Huiozyma naganishii CBS 8797]|uniref:Arrestin C-terminal-like domain-containing protein n=1 Tax=Huiozyma naganishii (strain ATCC MYA-139 / BCRC 22969 / CBS 8797 / KCTC 17520 / NBRC 10181 / NCYC 3082 / Yp74L-3) TaxID=1071383 RepID=J7RIA7_HUIN7|nr:hypothetical protein KNAG_0C01550 [Kazachstania naganishii CBS 8797]CCK69268.1 hypothetical protein KNAG_0C01550 [Kazachstania naganishii CBS 8797]
MSWPEFAHSRDLELRQQQQQQIKTILRHRWEFVSSETLLTAGRNYSYYFEYVVPPTAQESVRVDYAQTKYNLSLEIWKPHKRKPLCGKVPVQVVRSPHEDSLADTEPIVIAKNWKDSLFYEITVSSKSALLDAYLPISVYAMPIEKVHLHRVRIYLTETINYRYIPRRADADKEFHRRGPQNKYLLLEHNGPENDTNGVLDFFKRRPKNEVKSYGNLLQEDEGDTNNGDGNGQTCLANKLFEYDVYVPQIFNSFKQFHPDTNSREVEINHWLQVSLRISKMISDERKHFEVTVDTPIQLVNKLCSHANILPPRYDTTVRNSNATDQQFHSSNRRFPKEIYQTAILSPDVFSTDVTIPNVVVVPGSNPSNVTRLVHTTKRRSEPLLKTPKFLSNIYQPRVLPQGLTTAQAVPKSARNESETAIIDSDDSDPFSLLINDPKTDIAPPSYDESMLMANDHISKETTTTHWDDTVDEDLAAQWSRYKIEFVPNYAKRKRRTTSSTLTEANHIQVIKHTLPLQDGEEDMATLFNVEEHSGMPIPLNN